MVVTVGIPPVGWSGRGGYGGVGAVVRHDRWLEVRFVVVNLGCVCVCLCLCLWVEEREMEYRGGEGTIKNADSVIPLSLVGGIL